MSFKFPVINPLLHNELRLKIMVALDSLESANFMYLCEITGSTRGNLSVQIKTLQEAGYLQVDKSGSGPAARSVCRITHKGIDALRAYEHGLRRLFEERDRMDSEDYINRQSHYETDQEDYRALHSHRPDGQTFVQAPQTTHFSRSILMAPSLTLRAC